MDNEQLWFDKGVVEDTLNEKGESLISFNKSLDALKHKQAKIWCEIGYALYWLPEMEKSLAVGLLVEWNVKNPIDAFDRSLELDPDFSDSHYNKSIVLLDEGNFNESLKYINSAAKINLKFTNNSEFYYYRAMINYNLSKFSEATEDIIESFERNKFNLKTIYFMNSIGELKLALNESMKNEIKPYKEIKKTPNKDLEIRSTIGDIKFLINELNNTNLSESYITERIAHAKYDLSRNCCLGFINNRDGK